MIFRLLAAVRIAETGRAAAGDVPYREIVSAVEHDHVAEAEAHIRTKATRTDVTREITDECKELTKLLNAIAVVGEASPRARDLIVSTGEKLACIFMAGLLRDRGVDACYVDLSKTLAPGPDELDHDFYARISAAVTARVRGCAPRVPVVTGYFGVIRRGLLARVGRGYTDLCAALVAVGLRAAELQIWKEVDGVFTANPAQVPTARLLPELAPDEAAELTFWGSEVIHPFTMEQVVRAAIPIRIRNVANLRNEGTLVRPDPPPPTTPPASAPGDDEPAPLPKGVFAATSPASRRARSASLAGAPAAAARRRPKRPTAVTVKAQMLVINVQSNRRSLTHDFFARIFETMARFRLSVDMISTSEVHVSMAMHSTTAFQGGGGASSGGDGGGSGGRDEVERRVTDEDIAHAVQELRQYGTVDVLGNMAILSLVGREMKNMVGIAGKMFSVLGENNVNIEMISQGESRSVFSCVPLFAVLHTFYERFPGYFRRLESCGGTYQGDFTLPPGLWIDLSCSRIALSEFIPTRITLMRKSAFSPYMLCSVATHAF